jgi:hypothetical protein
MLRRTWVEMSPLTLGLLIGAIWLLVLVPVVGMVVWAKRGTEKARVGLEEMAGGRTARLQTRANSFGIRSRGKAQWRGLGHLALFDDELVFVQALAGNYVRAKVADIQGVSTPRAFLGKTAGRKLLAVEWRVGDGTDQVAFFVSELDRWVAELEQLTQRAAS